MGIFGFFNKNKKEVLDNGLEKTKHSVFDKISRAIMGKLIYILTTLNMNKTSELINFGFLFRSEV